VYCTLLFVRKIAYKAIATWFHFLCRHPSVEEFRILRESYNNGHGGQLPKNMALWDRFGCFLKVEPTDTTESNSSPILNHSHSTALSDQISTSDLDGKTIQTISRSQTTQLLNMRCLNSLQGCRVTLVCFGASGDLRDRLIGLKNSQIGDRWLEILHDPYILLDVIVDELYLQISHHVRSLRDEFRKMEDVS
jgi:hypothetical protein